MDLDLPTIYILNKEFKRAASLLTHNDPETFFRRMYCLYLSLDTLQDEASQINSNSGFQELLGLLLEYPDKDAFLHYLIGCVYLALGKKDNAKQALIHSVREYQFNWCAWKDLVSLIERPEEIEDILNPIPESFTTLCFKLYAWNEMNECSSDILSLIDDLSASYPSSKFLKLQKAVFHHNSRDFDEAEIIFEQTYAADPLLLDCMDVYSNVLYVKEKHAALCNLAQTMCEVDRFRPETCMVLGNYHSLKGDREKAIQSFSRALKLNPYFASAWTLMGHEYVELCNPQAAIQVYRKAVDLNPRDYRAWFGLGQAYDLLKIPNYSLYYYQKSLSVRDNDGRMWNALGASFETVGQNLQAIKCYKRALISSDTIEPHTLAKIAKLYHHSANKRSLEIAAYFYQKYLDEVNQDERTLGDFVDEASLFLAKYYSSIDAEKATHYMSAILHTEEGKSLQQEMYKERKRE